MNDSATLDQQIKKIVDIHGVSIGAIDDKSTWRVDYKSKPEPEIEKQVQEVINKFNFSSKEEVTAYCWARAQLNQTMVKALVLLLKNTAASKDSDKYRYELIKQLEVFEDG